MTSPSLLPDVMSVLDLVGHAEHLVTARIAPLVDAELDAYAALFGEARFEDVPDRGVNIVTFHADVPDSHRFIDYIDVKHDHHGFDYRRITQRFVDSALRFNPDARIFFITGPDGVGPEPDPRVRVVRLPLDPRAPMYERVKAATAYIRSAAFDRDTVFLDTDAFPNRPLAPAFDAHLDIGVTERPTENFYMPFNEGVIFAARRRPAAVRRFFDSYIGTYGALIQDPLVTDYYGEITRWRGGQLSLNAVALRLGAGQPAAGVVQADHPTVISLPCDSHNFWIVPNATPDPGLWNAKYVLHLKGDSKLLIAMLEQYQDDRFRTLEQGLAL
jgi:hypothetical protein